MIMLLEIRMSFWILLPLTWLISEIFFILKVSQKSEKEYAYNSKSYFAKDIKLICCEGNRMHNELWKCLSNFHAPQTKVLTFQFINFSIIETSLWTLIDESKFH